MADTEPTEKQIFRDHYSKLCNTMVDIDNLLPHFVQENIIQVDDLEEIKAKPRTTDKVEKLLQYISGPLQAGNVKSFYTMLSIMEEHGTQATRELASTMRNTSLAISDVNISEYIWYLFHSCHVHTYMHTNTWMVYQIVNGTFTPQIRGLHFVCSPGNQATYEM